MAISRPRGLGRNGSIFLLLMSALVSFVLSWTFPFAQAFVARLPTLTGVVRQQVPLTCSLSCLSLDCRHSSTSSTSTSVGFCTSSFHLLIARHSCRRRSQRLWSAASDGEEGTSAESNAGGQSSNGGEGEETLEASDMVDYTSFATPLWSSPSSSSSSLFLSSSSFPSSFSTPYFSPPPTPPTDPIQQLQQRILQKALKWRREGPLSTVLGHIPEENLDIRLLYSGQTNQAFRIYGKRNKRTPSSDGNNDEVDDVLFIKYAPDVVGDDGEVVMRKGGRTRTEWEGYREMGRVMPGMVPRTFVLEGGEEEGGGEGGLMVVEFLREYIPYAELLRRGQSGGGERGGQGVAVQVGRLLGRYHGTVMWNSAYVREEELWRTFENEEHIRFWERSFARPLLGLLRGGGEEEGGGLTKEFLGEELREIVKKDGGDRGVVWAVETLCREYKGRKEALVHADMHAMNILIKQGGRQEGREGAAIGAAAAAAATATVKIVDAEKTMWGPAGLDVGMFLANLAFYMATEEGGGEGGRGRGWGEVMQEVWWAYETEFLRVQGARGVGGGRTQDGLRGVFNDAVGYMGLWLLFLTVANPVEVLPLPVAEGWRKGGREEEMHANVMRVAVAALRDYAKFWRRREGGEGVSSSSVSWEREGEGDEKRTRTFWFSEEEEGRTEGRMEEGRMKTIDGLSGTRGGGEKEWKVPQYGARSRGPGCGVAGNNMQHVLEVLRDAIIPFSFLPSSDPRSKEECRAEEDVYMREVVLPERSRRADPAMFERDRNTGQWNEVSLEDEGEDGEENLGNEKVTTMMKMAAANLAAAGASSSAARLREQQEQRLKADSIQKRKDDYVAQEMDLMRMILEERTGKDVGLEGLGSSSSSSSSSSGISTSTSNRDTRESERAVTMKRLEEGRMREQLLAGMAPSFMEDEEEGGREGGLFTHESGQDDLATEAAAAEAAQARALAGAALQAKRQQQQRQEQQQEQQLLLRQAEEAMAAAAAAAAAVTAAAGISVPQLETEQQQQQQSSTSPNLPKIMMSMEKADEDVGKLRRTLSDTWPAFLQEMGEGGRGEQEGLSWEKAAGAQQVVTAAEEGQTEGQSEWRDTEEKEQQQQEFDAFIGPSFTPFPPEDLSSSSSRGTSPPPSRRQSWTSKGGGRGGGGKGGGGKRRKKT